MVAVIDQDSQRRDLSEAILAKLHFAVAPFDSVDKAVSTMQALRPEIIVARPDAAEQLKGRVPSDRNGRTIPLLVVTDDLAAPDVLVEELRRVLRDHLERSPGQLGA
jgi:DNA-binding NtrC family response regulator